jgi:indole-3-glycerol phosphate synthase
MKTILSEIIDYKRDEVERRKCKKPIETNSNFSRQSSPVSLRNALLKPDASGVIAEFKPKSPSEGIINCIADVAKVTCGYAEAGVSALSVLTDSHFFGSSFENFTIARTKNSCPILQKDFIIDEYQIYEAWLLGADVILLIAAVLSCNQVNKMAALCSELGMESILEIHSEDELDHLTPDVSIVGINSRNLKTFKVSLYDSVRISESVPAGLPKIAESGINSPEDVISLSRAGFNGFLIGSHFMHSAHPEESCKEFINQLTILKQRGC